jgi:L,D-peptidoglycan transpeptidase YkuD (ErfK/YbiS/YcfS/YnhG family)
VGILRRLLSAACLGSFAATTAGAPVVDAVTNQLVIVTVADWKATSGRLATFTRGSGQSWQRAGIAARVTIGRSGCGWAADLDPPTGPGPTKREGDGRSPAGIFPIGIAFGAADQLETGLEYRAMTAHDWCIDVAASPLYNRIVDDRVVGTGALAGSTEPMRRDLHLDGDRDYELGFVIGHNCDCVAGAGSCIFAHLWKDAATPTAGCTALAEPDLRALLAWLEADARPVFVLLPEAEHARVAAAWGLPAFAGGETP